MMLTKKPLVDPRHLRNFLRGAVFVLAVLLISCHSGKAMSGNPDSSSAVPKHACREWINELAEIRGTHSNCTTDSDCVGYESSPVGCNIAIHRSAKSEFDTFLKLVQSPQCQRLAPLIKCEALVGSVVRCESRTCAYVSVKAKP